MRLSDLKSSSDVRQHVLSRKAETPTSNDMNISYFQVPIKSFTLKVKSHMDHPA